MSSVFINEKLSLPTGVRYVPRPPANPPALSATDLMWHNVVFYGSLVTLTAIMAYLVWRR